MSSRRSTGRGAFRRSSPETWDLPEWPLWLLFAGFPLLWVVGLGGFVTQIAALPMGGYLLARRRINMPRGLGPWLLCLIWITFTVVEVSGGSRVIGFIYRLTLYVSATVAFLYVYNISPQRLPVRRLCAMGVAFLAFVTVGGYLGVIAPHHVLSTPVSHVLPHSLLKNSFVSTLVRPPFAQVTQSSYFHIAPRPAAPFSYTNTWGCNYALSVPFLVAGLASRIRLEAKVGMVVLLALSLVPALLTLNRGMILGLGVGLAYIAVRFAMRRHFGALAVVVLVVGLGLALMTSLHFGSRLENRTAQSHSVTARASNYLATYDQVKQSPLLGYGAPSSSTVATGQPDLGTQGQLWNMLYSAGFPGAFLFVAGLFNLAWRTRRPPDAARLWLHTVPVIAIVVLPFYGLSGTELVLVMAASAIVMRDRVPAGAVRRQSRAARPSPVSAQPAGVAG